MKSRKDIAKQMQADIKDSKNKLDQQYRHIREAQDFYNANIGRYKDTIQGFSPSGEMIKAQVQFNDVKPFVNYATGFFAQNRRDSKFTAKTNSPEARAYFSENANCLDRFLTKQCFSDQVETEQDKDMFMGGVGHLETALTYGQGFSSTSANGELEVMKLDPLMTGYDPYARKKNLMDARYKWYQQEYDLSVAMDLFDDADESDFAGIGNEDGWGRREFIQEFGDFSDKDKKRVKVYFYQWFENEPFYRANNPLYDVLPQERAYYYNEMLAIKGELSDDDNGLFDFSPELQIITFNAKIKKRLEALFPALKSYKYMRKVFYKAIGSGDAIFTATVAESQQGHSIDTKTGDWDASRGIWVGMVAAMMEPVLYKSKALTELMYTIAANAKGGVIIESDATDDINEFSEEYAKTDSVLVVNPGGINKIKPKQTPVPVTGLDSVATLSDDAIPRANGLDRSIFGTPQSGLETAALQRQRIKQTIVAFAGYADSITISQFSRARLRLDLLRIYAENNDGQLYNIINDDGSQDFVEISSNKLSAEYEISIEEAPQSMDERQEQGLALYNMATLVLPMNPQAGQIILAKSLKYTSLDRKDQDEITALLQPQDKQEIDPAYVQSLEAQLQQLLSDANQAELKKKLSDAALNDARTQQTIANMRLLQARVPQTQAQTAKTLEEAKRTGIEADVATLYPQQVTI